MKFYYPAVISRNSDGTYHARFPDLAMCEADGEDLMDVIENAKAAAYDWIDLEWKEPDPDLPAATDPADIPLKEGEAVHRILIIYRFLEGWDE